MPRAKSLVRSITLFSILKLALTLIMSIQKNGQHNEAYNPATCSVCNAMISNKTDMPRHMKMHSVDREKLCVVLVLYVHPLKSNDALPNRMHRCPYPDCNFENLQKSNVETHIRTQ